MVLIFFKIFFFGGFDSKIAFNFNNSFLKLFTSTSKLKLSCSSSCLKSLIDFCESDLSI